MSTKIIAAVLSLQTVIGYPQNLYLFLTIPVVYWCRKLEGSPLNKQLKDFLITMGIMAVCFALSLITDQVPRAEMLIPMFFVLGVFLVSVLTSGYVWGISASLFSVLAVNYAFTFPYFEVNFSIPVNFFSAVVMLVVAVVTCALTTKIKHAEKLKADSEREKMRANLLRAVSHDLRTPLTTIYGSSSMLLEDLPPRIAGTSCGASGTMPGGWWAWWRTCSRSPVWTAAS